MVEKANVKSVATEKIAKIANSRIVRSRHFRGHGMNVPAVQRVNIDFTLPMLQELNNQANELNISRQAVIKMLIRQGLDHHYLACQKAEFSE